MPGKANLVSIFSMLIGGLLFSLALASAFPSAFCEPDKLDKLDEGEMQRAGAGHGLFLAALESQSTGRAVSRVINISWPVSRVIYSEWSRSGRTEGIVPENGPRVPHEMRHLPEEAMDVIVAGRPVGFTLQGLDVTFWAPLYELLKPLAEEQELMVPVHGFTIRRNYYDVTMERYGWEIDTLDLERAWRQFHVTGVGQDGKALPLEVIVVDNYKYRPGGLPEWRHGITEPFRNLSEGGRVSWLWRQAYFVHFEKY